MAKEEETKTPNVTPKYSPAENTELIKGTTDSGIVVDWSFFDGQYHGFEEFEEKLTEYVNKQTIDEEIKEQAHWLANNFSTRNGYTSMEENLIKMGEFVKNRMLDKYNFKNE